MMNDRRNVCFCQTGHPVFYVGSMQPPNCRTCGAHINLAKGSMPVAEAQRRGLLDPPKQEKPAEPAAQPEAPAAQPAAQTPPPQAQPTPVPQNPGFRPTPTPQAPGYAPAPPSGPAYSVPQSAPAAPAYASAPPRPTPVAGYGQPPQAPAYGQAPQATPPRSMFFGQQFGAAPTPGPANQQSSCQLDFFGEKIDIPQEGGWIGRSELGSQWLEGNLLISRRHVHVRPTPDGTLSVGPDSSLNGVSYDDGTGKRALQPSETVNLAVGSTIWLYNIPLKLERKST